MSRAANVSSIDAVKRFRLSTQKFDADVREALVQLSLEMRRAIDWLEVDRARYWPNEVRKSQNKVAEARINLERCELSITPGDRASCYDEKKALEKAKRRLRTAEEKVKAVKRWCLKAKGEAEEFEAEMNKLNGTLDTEMPRAIAALDRMIKALDQYAQRAAPAQIDPPTPPDDPR